MMNRKECGRNLSWLCYPGIGLEELKKNRKNVLGFSASGPRFWIRSRIAAHSTSIPGVVFVPAIHVFQWSKSVPAVTGIGCRFDCESESLYVQVARSCSNLCYHGYCRCSAIGMLCQVSTWMRSVWKWRHRHMTALTRVRSLGVCWHPTDCVTAAVIFRSMS